MPIWQTTCFSSKIMIDFKKEIVLEDERVRLEPISLDHLEGLFHAGAQDETLLQFSFNRVHTRELVLDYLKQFILDREKSSRYAFSIYDKMLGNYAGVTTFLNISGAHQRLEIGSTWIGKQFQRTGINRHCKFLLLCYCFEEIEVERVELKTDSRNEQSKTAIQKIGARFEGELRNHSVMPDGFRRNTSVYSIIRSEWPIIQVERFSNFRS